ncbi:MAG: hypothetical protein EAZ89_12910 [Bacteroidetes bacterium]|nr:MAG: hypothetical protein EAZ89_12910 [Bacteroidota bacterium]
MRHLISILIATLVAGFSFQLSAQVTSRTYKQPNPPQQQGTTRSDARMATGTGSSTGSVPGAVGTYSLQKEVPDREPPKITGNGKPVNLYVVQLARFEEMTTIPPSFPQGTFLWANPDHINEKLLLSGFYNSYQEAVAAAAVWKKKYMFKDAFARTKPFITQYQ